MQFSELVDGDKFMHNNVEYTKIAPVKISCCKSVNALRTDNSKQRIFVPPQQQVEKVTSAQ